MNKIEWPLPTSGASTYIKSGCCNAPIRLMQNTEVFQMDIELVECVQCGMGLGVVAGEFKWHLMNSM